MKEMRNIVFIYSIDLDWALQIKALAQCELSIRLRSVIGVQQILYFERRVVVRFRADHRRNCIVTLYNLKINNRTERFAIINRVCQ